MFPVVATILIFGSVLLMFLWEFRPLIEKKVFPFFIELLSVAEEKQTRSPIYLASTRLDSEFSMLVKSAEKLVFFGFPTISNFQFINLLEKIDDTAIIRVILAKEPEMEHLKQTATQLARSTEIIYRPRIHFKILGTDQRVAIGSTSLLSNNPIAFHDLTVISSDPKIAKEARHYLSAFYEGVNDYPMPKETYTISSPLPRKTKSLFVNTSNGLSDIVHGLLSSAKESVTLISPFITNDIAEYLLNIISRNVQVKFITNVNWRHWINQLSDPEALETLLSDRIIIENCPNLHANCIIVDGQAAVVSSQNLTTQSWFSRDEAGIFTKNPELIKTILQRIASWQPKHRLTMAFLEEEIAQFDAALAKETEPPASIPELTKETMVPASDDGEPLAPPLLGFTALTQPKPLITTIPQQTKQPSSPQTTSEPQWIEDIVYVGKKRTVEYVRACQHQIKRKGSVTIRARGKLIYRAVDVAERLRMHEELEVFLNRDSIKIETYYPTGKETTWGGVSQIAITLHQKN